MKILVLLKQTFDTEEQIVIKQDIIIEDGVNFIINPYDEFALEEALVIKEKLGAEVTVVTVGPTRAESSLRTALAMGADHAVLIDNQSINEDEFSISKILAAFAKRDSYDIILGGYMAVDDGSAQVGPRVAEELAIPHISAIVKLEIKDRKVIVEKDVEGDIVVVESPIPVLLTAQQGLNEPRYPSLQGILKAKKKPIEHLTLKELNINLEEIRAKTEVLNQYLAPRKQTGRILEGEIEDQVNQLVASLKNEAKVI